MQSNPTIVNVGPQLFHSPQLPRHPTHAPTHPSNPPPPPQPSHPPPLPLHTSSVLTQNDPQDSGRHTTPLEPMSMSPQLATTLEHIVGQLDILTQVNKLSHQSHSIFLR